MLINIARYRVLIPVISIFLTLYTYGVNEYYNRPKQTSVPLALQITTPATIEVVETPKAVAVVEKATPTHYKEFPIPKADGSYEAYKPLFEAVAKATDTDVMTLAHFAAMESSFRKAADPGKGTARGLFQFNDDTWEFAVKRHGKAFGITLATPATDVRAATIITALTLKDNYKLLEKHVTGRKIVMTDLYLVHLLGRTGSLRFLKAHPAGIAAKDMPRQAKANANVFYREKQPLTYREVRVAIVERIKTNAKDFNIA